MTWLQRELARFRVAGREITLKRWHGIPVLAAIVIVALLLIGGGVAYKYETLPRPPLPATEQAPSSNCTNGKDGTMGACLPAPKAAPQGPTASLGTHSDVIFVTASGAQIAGPDLSNNDPVPCSAFASIAKHSQFVYVKSVEGTGFTDSTAAHMAACAKSYGLPVGGYDFQHVCGPNPADEARHFVNELAAQGLLGKGTLRPSADTEYGSSSCSGRVWLQAWVDYVVAHDGPNGGPGPCPIDYTGAWWWQPHIGSWWPTCHNVQLTDWISGYGVSWPYMPSGRSTLDLWQKYDNGYNGYSSGDYSLWMRPPSLFDSLVGAGAVAPVVDRYAVLPAVYVPTAHGKLSERASVKAWDQHRCATSSKDAECSHLRRELLALEHRLYPIGHREGWVKFHRGTRYQIMRRRSG